MNAVKSIQSFHMNNKAHPCHKNTEEAVAPDDTLIEQKTL
jgi:hypothetical protein